MNVYIVCSHHHCCMVIKAQEEEQAKQQYVNETQSIADESLEAILLYKENRENDGKQEEHTSFI